eukprot:TRINITY_DN15555_c0_g1_i1.p1 TRINITY_DN15555_c0_g1~~TRINITY_DN15555_c0_g1_i1.p1  ORF type:complete len:365 (+),score=90.33 TRINITY_DN15555_c0_g1_i1:56-1150(+)
MTLQPTQENPLKVGVLGAGLIGLYLGSVLQASKMAKVTFFGRERMWKEIVEAKGLSVEEGTGLTTLPIEELEFRLPEDEEAGKPLNELDVVLVTLKTQHIKGLKTPPKIPEGALIVSMCNGLDSVSLLRNTYPQHRVVNGMFGPNVIMVPPATMVKTTSGLILLDAHPVTTALTAVLTTAKIDCSTVDDVMSVKWAKLLINTNNAVNALSGLPLSRQLRQQPYRMVWAAAMREGLKVCQAEGVTPAKIMAIPPLYMPYALEVPDTVFTRVAKGLVSIDERAGSSMLEDIMGGRPSEIAYLNGTLADTAAKHAIPTPVNDALITLIRQAETAKTSPCLTGDELLDKVCEISGWKPTYYSSSCSVM